MPARVETPGTPARAGPGRPRSPEAEGAILDATLELLARDGLDGLSMDAVAARAGVGKATIYRRWPSRDGLVAAALGSMTNDLEVPDTGSVHDDLIALLRSFQRAAVRSLPDQLKPRLIALALSNARLNEIFMANVFQPRRRALIEVLERGEARGELRAGLDMEQVFTMIHGPMLHMALLGDTQAVSDSATPARIVETLMDGIAAKRAP